MMRLVSHINTVRVNIRKMTVDISFYDSVIQLQIKTEISQRLQMAAECDLCSDLRQQQAVFHTRLPLVK